MTTNFKFRQQVLVISPDQSRSDAARIGRFDRETSAAGRADMTARGYVPVTGFGLVHCSQLRLANSKA